METIGDSAVTAAAGDRRCPPFISFTADDFANRGIFIFGPSVSFLSWVVEGLDNEAISPSIDFSGKVSMEAGADAEASDVGGAVAVAVADSDPAADVSADISPVVTVVVEMEASLSLFAFETCEVRALIFVAEEASEV